MRIRKTGSPTQVKSKSKPVRSASAAKAKTKKSAAPMELSQASRSTLTSGARQAMQRLADGLSQLQARPLSAPTAQAALASLRGG